MFKKLEAIKKVATPFFDIPEQLYQLMEEYRDKHKEYQVASNSFVEYLRSSQQCSNTQLHKLDSKYETIRSNCEYSRRILNNEIPVLILSLIHI